MIKNHHANKLNSVFICIIFLFLASCGMQDSDENTNNNKNDWVKDEILQQLVEIRKDIKSLKDDVAKLDSKINTAGAGKPRQAPPPKQVKLDLGVSLGSDKAKIAIVEFADYQCPFCARHSKTVLPKIKKELVKSGKVKYVLYDYPLGFHPKAKPAAVAARCAGKQNKYWEMHGLIFDKQRELSEALYTGLAKQLKLNTEAFTQCFKKGEELKKVEANIQYGQQLGVTGTPKFYIGKINNNVITDVKVISGAQAYTAFVRTVNQLSQ